MDNDREEAGPMTSDWTTPEYLANIAADELRNALTAHGIHVRNCSGDDDGDVNVSLGDLRDAETMLTLAFEGPAGPATLYDRATGSCVALSALAQKYGDDPPEAAVATLFTLGWTWMIHPHMEGRRTGWHVSVTLSNGDANEVTARLNEIRNGAAL